MPDKPNQEKIESPCIDECALADGECLGCGRTMDEIVSWGSMTPEERKEVRDRLAQE